MKFMKMKFTCVSNLILFGQIKWSDY